jgi:outer membrane receptor protein involved in Fe transport
VNRTGVVVAALLLGLAEGQAVAQLQLATIRGLVLDVSGQPAAAVSVELTDPLGGIVDTRATGSDGRFSFPSVAPGRYTIRTRAADDEPLLHPLTVDAAMPIDVTLRFPLRTAAQVVVGAAIEVGSPVTRMSVAGESIAQVPLRSIAKGVQDVVATLPGWATEDNGLLHVRGIDDGFLYVIDGVPVYERLDQLSGLGPDTGSIESINVMTGNIPAEYGYKAGGVIDVRSRSSMQSWLGSVEAGGGSDDTVQGSLSVSGPISERLSVAVSSAAERSDRLLDPVHPDNLHNNGAVAGLTGSMTWTPSAATVVSINVGGGQSDYDVPNTEEQEDALQDQRQRLSQRYGAVTWQRAWSGNTYSQVSGYLRHSEALLDGSANDTPLFADADRSLARAGAIARVSRQAGRHTIKAGFEIQRLSLDESFQFAVTDEDAAEDAGFSDEAIEFDLDDPFVFADQATPTLWSAYVQDEWRSTDRLTISAGLRFDESRVLLLRRQVSPRIGVGYRVGHSTVLRGSASRYFQPPQPENLLLSSSEEARQLSPFAEDGEGGADVEPERQWAFEAGFDHRFGPLVRLDGAFWYRRIVEAADPNVFAGTTIIFPNAVARGRARGFDARLEIARRRSWSGYANVSVGRVRQNGPITGGLFLEDEIGELGDGEEFIPDHDQRVVASGGVTWTPTQSGASVAFTVRYETGTPIEREEDEEDELMERPGAERVDFESGRVKPRTIASLQAEVPFFKGGRYAARLRASVLNLFDQRYAYNFGNPFSGTHFGAPRTMSLGARVSF